ncbi:MAG TPA: NAD(P)/FAD-dependent oxidoreductase [Arachnia sp.]|nr:NAD(P)/FAD-dependent oxidoreductase [Arachnia sp.]
METYDIAVLGMGPGGEHVAEALTDHGLAVLGVDRLLVGGECPYWGCIPSKMMVRAAQLLAEARRVPDFAGSTGEVRSDWSVVARRIREEATDSWDDRVAVERFTGKGGTFVRGTGRLTGPGRIDVDGVRFALTRGVIVATGASASIPPIEGLDSVPFWTNRDVVEAEELPSSIVVLGGGAIGSELSQVLARFGVRVTIVEAADHLLGMEEPEAGEALREALEADGVTVNLGVRARRVERDGDGVAVIIDPGRVVKAERLLVATGRRANPAEAGLESVGVPADARFAPIDDHCRITDGVWALGDVTGKGAFTHVSMYQADIVIRDVLGLDGPPASYHALPRVTFTDPEVGAVGLTERQARQAYANVRVGSIAMSSTTRGWIHGGSGVIKVVEDADTGVLVGATAVGPTGGEILGALAVAVHARVPVDVMRSMIYAYPTFHRGIEAALQSLR